MGDYSKMGPNEQKTYNNCEHKNISMVIDGVLLRVDTYYKNLGKGCGVVCGEVGAYIMDEYRDKGIGSNFIQMISEYCIHKLCSCTMGNSKSLCKQVLEEVLYSYCAILNFSLGYQF